MNKKVITLLIIFLILITNVISFFAGIQSGSSIWRNDLILLGNQISNINHEKPIYTETDLPILCSTAKNSTTVYMGFLADTEVTIKYDDYGKVSTIIHDK